MNKEQKDQRDKFIENIQAITKANAGVKPSRKQVENHVGKWPGELSPDSPPWMKPIQAEHIVKGN